MAIITDPDNLNQGVEVTITTSTKKIALNIAGNLSTDGVSLQALYSFLKEEWKNDATLIVFPFPMVAITPEQFEFVSDWELANDNSRKLIRFGGWAEVTSADVKKREYLGVVTLGNIDTGDKAYYAFAGDTSKTDFVYPGTVNEAIQTYGNATNGNFNKKNSVLTIYIRVQGKTYGQVTSTDIGVTNIAYKVERFPLQETSDLKISASDATIAASAPYTGMSIEFFATPQSKTMGASSYNFGIIVNGNGGTAKQVYEFIQYKLRQNSDIDAGTNVVNGLLTNSMAAFVGDRLDTLSVSNIAGGGAGVYINNLSSSSVNDVRYVDNLSTYRVFPFVASGVINFSQTLINDASAIFKMFFTSNPAGNFGTANAVQVNSASGTPIGGSISGNSQVSFTFDYDANIQGGRSPAVDAQITIVAIGLANAQYVSTTSTISRSTSNIVSLVSALERNYQNN